MDDNQQLLPPDDASDPKSPASDPLISGETRRNSKGQFGAGNSANNSGRPPKIYNQSAVLVTSLLEEEATAITQAAIAAAKEGNPLAIKLCLDRLSPAPHTRSVRLKLPDAAQGKDRYANTLLADHTAILLAVAEGAITPEEGERISSLVEARRRSWESTKLADLIESLRDDVEAVKRSKGTRPKIVWDDSWQDDPEPADDATPNGDSSLDAKKDGRQNGKEAPKQNPKPEREPDGKKAK